MFWIRGGVGAHSDTDIDPQLHTLGGRPGNLFFKTLVWITAGHQLFLYRTLAFTLFLVEDYFLDTKHGCYLFCLADAFGFVNYEAISK